MDDRRSGAPHDLELESDEARFQKGATELITQLFVLVKIGLVHRMDNRAVEPVIARFRGALARFQIDVAPEAAVQFVGDAVYVNRRLVRADLGTWEKARFLKEFFARMQIAEITFHERVPEESVRDLVQAVRDVALDPARIDEVRTRGFTGLTFRDLHARGVGLAPDALVVPDAVRVLRGYGIVVATIGELVECLQSGKSAPLIAVRRAVQELVRLPEHTRPLQLGLLSLEHYRGQLAGRMANIGLMVVLMAKRLGLGVAISRDMGVAAALSGLGRLLSSELVYAKPDQVAAWDGFVEGARWLVPFSGQGRAAALRLIAAVEQSDAQGRRHGHPLSRLVAVADRYDLLTQRPPRGPGMQPDAALRALLDANDLDRSAARLLVSTLGLFPVGSTVKLTSGETAIVVDVTDDPQRLAEPRVMIVADAAGGPVDRRIVDLAGSGAAIAGTIDPAGIDLNVGHFLFA